MRMFVATSPAATCSLAAAVAALLEPGDFIALQGELGAGKTTFAQGLARGLGVPAGMPVTSPTYTLLNIYQTPMPLYHFDLYRLAGDDDAIAAGFDEYFAGNGICLVEWPERLDSLLPPSRLEILLEYHDDETRRIELRPIGDRFLRLVAALPADELIFSK